MRNSLGLAIILVGFCFLLGYLEILRSPGDILLHYWPLFLIFVGLETILGEKSRVFFQLTAFAALGFFLALILQKFLDVTALIPF
ncbi:MAG: hypothetical protein J7K11_08090 [Candidatus Hydrothermae bacterium]|nr:hypothetical protein [Candidatus Hydrothermae bacterium]